MNIADTTSRIDPLAPHPSGRYADALVCVVHGSHSEDTQATPIVRTEHFTLRRRGNRVEVQHALRAEQLDNDLAGLLADELFAPGWLSGSDIFERVFTGVVLSSADDALGAWITFYDNTLTRIRDAWRHPQAAGHSSITGFAPVYRRTLDLVRPGTVLDIGSCFGFLPLLLAERGDMVTASDLSPGTMRLLGVVAEARDLDASTLICDAARVPLPDRSVDAVTVIHVLEHLTPSHGDAVVREALRLARRQVVVAVPYEDEPTAAFGHIRAFSADELAELGHGTHRPFTVASHHGGWLILDAG